MKKIIYLCAAIASIMVITSCSKDETYADQLKREDKAIAEYLSKNKITTISESQFASQDSTTDVSKNQYVKFNNSGVYMQIINKGTGKKINSGENVTVLARFDEYNLFKDTLQLSNRNLTFSGVVDKMSITKTSGTFTGSFNTPSSVMYKAYQSAAVPAGWLAVMPYVNLGREAAANASTAHVKIIVPASQGTSFASKNVIPMVYDLTLSRGL